MPRLTSGQVLTWIFTIVLSAFLVYRFIFVVLTDGGGWLGIVGGIVSGVLLIFCVSLRSVFRERLLRASFPGAFVASIGGYTPLSSQLKAAADSIGGEVTRFYPGFLAVTVDQWELRVIGGFFFGIVGRPRIRATIPLAGLSDIRLVKAEQGKWVLDSLEFLLVAEDGTLLPIDLLVTAVRFGLPLQLPKRKLAAYLEAAKRAWPTIAA